MANVLSVDGVVGPDVPLVRTFLKMFPKGCRVNHDRLHDGRMMHSRLDVTEFNPTASEMAERMVFGPALLSRDAEAWGG
jgi:hypothetical protein